MVANRRGDGISPNGLPKLLFYSYSISGVTYETAQDITGLEEQLHLDRVAAGQTASVKYDPSNPSTPSFSPTTGPASTRSSPSHGEARYREGSQGSIYFLSGQRSGNKLRDNGRAVPVDSQGHNFDFELRATRAGSPPIALEIFRLVGDPQEIAAEVLHGQVWNQLRQELESRGIRDYSIETPPRFQISKAQIGEYCREHANTIEEVLKADPNIEEFETGPFKIKKYEGLGTVVFTSHHGLGQIFPETSARDASNRNYQLKKINCHLTVTNA